MKTNESLLAERDRHIPQGPFNTHPIFASKAEGAVITDVEGKEYIDFAGGIGVANAGHCDDQVVNAIKDQAERYIHTCFHVVMYEPYIELAKKLNELTPGAFHKKTMFANSGAEAVENAVKISRHARSVRPWKASSKAMMADLPVACLEILTAFSTASAPLLANMVFLWKAPGVSSFSFFASSI